MEYPQTRTQEFNLNQEKMIFSATPSPSGWGTVATPLISGMTSLNKNFYDSFVALTLKGG